MTVKTPARVCFKTCLAFMLFTMTVQAVAQSAPVDPGMLVKMNTAPVKQFNALDLEALAVEDVLTDSFSGVSKRFAVPRKVQLSLKNAGVWEQKPNGDRVWRLRVRGDSAAHLNFGFNRFVMPPGASLTIVAADGSGKVGPFTVEDMLPHGQLWTPVVPGEEALFYLSVPAAAAGEPLELELSQINQGYRAFGMRSKVCKSGSCNLDVACLAPDDPWNENRRAVGAWTNSGVTTCSGTLLNNTANDRRMLFATATHCGVSSNQEAASVVVYWNYESPTCRVPGSADSGAASAPFPDSFSPGLGLLAATNNPFAGTGEAQTRSDWTLLELAAPPTDNDFGLFWSGWDRREPPVVCASPSDPAGTDGLCASIHHPGVDEKRITFVEVPMTLDGIAQASDVHWLARWDPTPPRLAAISPMPQTLPPAVTEPGSSGSALFNADRRLVGVLSGGASFCGATGSALSDQYGGLFHAWDGLGTASSRMRDHLDPSGLAPPFIDGLDSCDAPPAPQGLSASATGDNEVSLSWNASPGADQYRVLRSIGTCPGTGFVQIAEVQGTGFVDTTVSGGADYVYRIEAVEDGCASARSSCDGVSATGVCTLAPVFDGLASARSANTQACGVALDWAAASSRCGNNNQLRYNVYRAAEANFQPSSGNRIAVCESATTYLDSGLESEQSAFYLVRAEDLSAASAAGQCGGAQDANLLRRSAGPTGPEQLLLQDDVESGGALWLASGTGAGADFSIVTDASSSPVSSWFVPDPDAVSDRSLTLATALNLPANVRITLRFQHRFDTEVSFDGGVLEYSIDGGTNWQDILAGANGVPANPGRFISGGYLEVIDNRFGSPIANRESWTGSSNGQFVPVAVDLSDFAGQPLLIRFRAASDSSLAAVGWWIDDIAISVNSACDFQGDGLWLRDGFEAIP